MKKLCMLLLLFAALLPLPGLAWVYGELAEKKSPRKVLWLKAFRGDLFQSQHKMIRKNPR